jgi:CheY-like chemotaxis protein
VLGSTGHSVECVRSGQEAISRFSAARFDLVLIDGQERREVARAIKDAAPSTRVILTTGNAGLVEADGVDVILHKPFSFEDDLERALAECRGGTRRADDVQ